MDEAEQVLDRLRKIELLDGQQAPAEVLLGELRELLAEAEAWARLEAPGTAGVDALRAALEHGEESLLGAERTLVA
jgi:hypothetical protein